MSAALELQDVACHRAGRMLFSGMSRQVRAGELLRVEGANGAGKTTLLRMLCGLMEPSHGQVLWRGENVIGLREDHGRDLIYLGHAAALKDELSPLENLRLSCALAGRQASEVEAMQALDEAGLRGAENTGVRRLSQGQRRRAALARLALARSAARWVPLWVLDEPFNALDTQASTWLCGLIQAQLQRQGTVVLTSHQRIDLDDAPQQVLAL